MITTTRRCLLYGCLTPVALVILLIVGLIMLDTMLPSKARRALPDSATEVKEYDLDAGMIGDFVRVLNARLPETDFPQYAQSLGLTQRYDPSEHSSMETQINLSMNLNDLAAWWDEPTDMDNCYFEYAPGTEYLVRVKWKDGWVYFVAFAW